jgi:hypothetical protein
MDLIETGFERGGLAGIGLHRLIGDRRRLVGARVGGCHDLASLPSLPDWESD